MKTITKVWRTKLNKCKYVYNSNKDTNVKCFCNYCHIETKHQILFDVFENGIETENGITWRDDYQIIKCNNCDLIKFRKDGWFSEYQDCFPGGSDGSYEVLYPESNEDVRQTKNFKHLPYSLLDIYEEVIKSYNHRLAILSAVGIRAILEGICKDKKVYSGKVKEKDGSEKVKKDLRAKILGLYQKGIINNIQLEALHELRFLGNNAVHELKEPTISDIRIALDIIEHMINDIYELPLKADKLKTNRN